MRNTIGVILLALGAGLVALPYSTAVAAALCGGLLALGSVLLLIDWTGQ